MNFGIVARKLLPSVLTFTLSLAAAALAQGPAAEATSQSSGTESSSKPAASARDSWHVGLSPYLWFAGVHGTVGALGHETGVNASFGDIFSYFNIGLMGEVEARKKRFLLATDIMWMRLSDEKALPINEVGIQSVDAKMKQFLLTPIVGYRVVDKKIIKVDATVGLRYWHLGESLEFKPSLMGGVSRSQNWADVLGGARIHIPLSQKAMVTIVGDAGGGGANSDYQVAGLLGYTIRKKCILQVGWRYLDANYRGTQSFVYDTERSTVGPGDQTQMTSYL
jgi:hypothetical protein